MSTAIAERAETQVPATQPSESAAILSLIERMAADPSIDLDRVERVIAMRESLERKLGEKDFNAAMALAQAEMGPVSVNATNPQTRSRYATYDQLDRALRPIYTKHGFALSFDEQDSPKPEHIRIVCIVSHSAGFARTYHRDMPADGKGAKGGDVMTKTHAIGAAASYGMRYLLRGIFNVATGEGDTDGNQPGDLITQDQADKLSDLIDVAVEETKSTRPVYEKRFLAYMKAEKISDIAAKDYDRALASINSTRPAK